MEKVTALLNRQYGPVKVWYVVAALFVGILSYMAYSALKNPSPASADEVAAVADGETLAGQDGLDYGEAYPTSGLVGGGLGNGGGSSVPAIGNTDTPSATDDEIADNADWLKVAARKTAGPEGVSQQDAYNALSKYLTGAQLSGEEGKIRDRALQIVGWPPSPPDSSTTLKTPVTVTPNLPTTPNVPVVMPEPISQPINAKPNPATGSVSTIPDALKNAGPISFDVNANENSSSFQTRVYNKYGFTPTIAQLNAYNSANSNHDRTKTISAMVNGNNHIATDIIIKP